MPRPSSSVAVRLASVAVVCASCRYAVSPPLDAGPGAPDAPRAEAAIVDLGSADASGSADLGAFDASAEDASSSDCNITAVGVSVAATQLPDRAVSQGTAAVTVRVSGTRLDLATTAALEGLTVSALDAQPTTLTFTVDVPHGAALPDDAPLSPRALALRGSTCTADFPGALVVTALHVSPSGRDGARATPSDPLLTLTEAASRASAGDRIQLAGGSYGPSELLFTDPARRVPTGVTVVGSTDASGAPTSTLTCADAASTVALHPAGALTVRRLRVRDCAIGLLADRPGAVALEGVSFVSCDVGVQTAAQADVTLRALSPAACAIDGARLGALVGRASGLTLVDCDVATSAEFGVKVQEARLRMTRGSIVDTSDAADAAGLRLEGGSATLDGTLLARNARSALYLALGTATLTDVTVRENSAAESATGPFAPYPIEVPGNFVAPPSLSILGRSRLADNWHGAIHVGASSRIELAGVSPAPTEDDWVQLSGNLNAPALFVSGGDGIDLSIRRARFTRNTGALHLEPSRGNRLRAAVGDPRDGRAAVFRDNFNYAITVAGSGFTDLTLDSADLDNCVIGLSIATGGSIEVTDTLIRRNAVQGVGLYAGAWVGDVRLGLNTRGLPGVQFDSNGTVQSGPDLLDARAPGQGPALVSVRASFRQRTGGDLEWSGRRESNITSSDALTESPRSPTAWTTRGAPIDFGPRVF